MNPIRKVITAHRYGKALDVGHARPGGAAWWMSLSKQLPKMKDVGDGSNNSIVFSALNVITNSFVEAPPAVMEEVATNQEEIVPNHPATEILENPNPYMTADLLWAYYVWSSRVDGNAYFYKARSAANRVVELWPLMPSLVEPHAPMTDDQTFIDYYSYRPRGIEKRIDPDDILHLRTGLDPTNHRKGIGPVKVVLGEILGDEAAGQFATALLSNMGIPGVIIGPAEGEVGPEGDEADAIVDMWQEKFGGGRQGEPLVLENRAEIKVVSFSPKNMDLTALRRVPEERITAALGVPAILAGMGAGMEATSGRAESGTLRELFTETTIIPDWNRVARQLTAWLLPEFELATNRRIGFDMSNVRALQEDRTKVWERVDRAVRSGWLTVAEAKRMVGLEPEPQDDVYLRTISTEEVPVAEGRRLADVA